MRTANQNSIAVSSSRRRGGRRIETMKNQRRPPERIWTSRHDYSRPRGLENGRRSHRNPVQPAAEKPAPCQSACASIRRRAGRGLPRHSASSRRTPDDQDTGQGVGGERTRPGYPRSRRPESDEQPAPITPPLASSSSWRGCALSSGSVLAVSCHLHPSFQGQCCRVDRGYARSRYIG